MTHHGLRDIALHPTRPISYVAFKAGFDVPRYRFIVYNEQTGEGRESDDLIGTWLRVDPAGRFLVAGYTDLYEAGSRLLVNPDRIHVVPEYGRIDWLVRYEIGRDGMPVQDELKEKVGGNGQGLRMSRDGRRVTYLSHVGYPQFSGNLAGWDPTDFEKMPVSYQTKDRGTTYDLAYHPVLPLVASPGSGSAVFFHRETGDLEPDRLQLPDGAAGLGGETLKIHRVYFSPDGKHVVFDTSLNDIHYLQGVALRLKPEELRQIDAAVKAGGSSVGAEPVRPAPAEKAPLKALDSLAGGPGKSMSTRDVARWFTDSVVVVRNDESSGTGFVVGREGYVLTCEHVLPRRGNTTVVYREPETRAKRTTVAKIVAANEEEDLALLKIQTAVPLRSVRFDLGDPVERGQQVAVIGNPGLGGTILDHTMTEGIVSSPRRDLAGQTFIQTSASINPGSSGGPMFNDRGLVVGLVVLKADIEAAGFAVPVDRIVPFLLSAADTTGPNMTLRRTWIDSTGQHQIDALYGGVVQGKVRLKKTDGRIIFLTPSQLSPADQSFIRLLNP
jgi:S1-C subfamily serine protease